MQIRKQEATDKVLLYRRHFIATDVLQIPDCKLDRIPTAMHVSADPELLRQAKLEVDIRPGRSNKAEIAVMEHKVPGRIGATRELDGELVVKVKISRERAPCLCFTLCEPFILTIERIKPGR